MKEALFLKGNIDKWTRFEQQLETTEDPDLLAGNFIELTDDLAYALTFYPQSKTSGYLNGIASRFHQKLYKNKREAGSRIWSFWQYELPYLLRRYHRYLLYAFLFFIVFTGVGILSTSRDSSFIRLVLGDHYVNMTLENIRKGDPFGIYQSKGEFFMFLAIALNNIRVAFFAYVLGISGGIFTVFLLMRNGIMLGAFETFFFQRGLGWDSILAIFIHGTIEISVIIVAGCAGLILGSSLLFPGTYDRWRSLLRGGKDAMKIAFGLVPFFLVAAFFESFVTRHYRQIPLGVNLLILSGSLVLILWYFVFYPLRLHHRVNRAKNENHSSQTDHNFNQWLNQKLNSEK